jgi:hypothetical protein
MISPRAARTTLGGRQQRLHDSPDLVCENPITHHSKIITDNPALDWQTRSSQSEQPGEISLTSPGQHMMPAAVTDAPGVAATSGRSVARRAKLVVLLVVAVVAVIKAPQLGSAVATAVGSAAVASPRWLALALTLAVGSMLAFAVLRRSLLRSTGDVISWRSVVSIGYTAGAVRLTMPAGGLLAVAHTFRRLPDLGVRPGAVTWSLAVGGCCPAPLTTLGLGAVAVGTGSSAVLNGMWGAAGRCGGRRDALVHHASGARRRITQRVV